MSEVYVRAVYLDWGGTKASSRWSTAMDNAAGCFLCAVDTMSTRRMSENGEGVESPELALMPVASSNVVGETDEHMVPEVPQPGLLLKNSILALHLHRHEYVHAVVDDEARALISRLARQHGELFLY